MAIFETRFIVDAPGSWAQGAGGPAVAPDLGAEVDELGRTPAGAYRPISAKWAERLERWCGIYDRQTGRAGDGLVSLIDDVLAWQPEHGAPRGARHDDVDLNGRPTRHTSDPGWPASLAYFIARLGQRAKAIRRQQDERRRRNAIDWRVDQDLGRITPPGPNPHAAKRNQDFADDFYADLAELDDDENDAQSGDY